MSEKFTRADFTVALAREWFAYDPRAGVVFSIKNPKRGPQRAGKPAGTPHKSHGYRQVSFRGLRIPEHHLAWALYYGYWPPFPINFADEDKLNLRIDNLCGETNTLESYKGLQFESNLDETPLSGVIPTPSGKFRAQIYRGKIIHLGTFSTPAEASQAYQRAKQVLHSPLNRKFPTEELLLQVQLS